MPDTSDSVFAPTAGSFLLNGIRELLSKGKLSDKEIELLLSDDSKAIIGCSYPVLCDSDDRIAELKERSGKPRYAIGEKSALKYKGKPLYVTSELTPKHYAPTAAYFARFGLTVETLVSICRDRNAPCSELPQAIRFFTENRNRRPLR